MKTTTEKKIAKLVRDERLFKRLDYLEARWHDEKEYEDFSDYEYSMKKNLHKICPDFEFIKGIKRPFGFTGKIDNQKIKVGFYILKNNKIQIKASFK